MVVPSSVVNVISTEDDDVVDPSPDIDKISVGSVVEIVRSVANINSAAGRIEVDPSSAIPIISIVRDVEVAPSEADVILSVRTDVEVEVSAANINISSVDEAVTSALVDIEVMCSSMLDTIMLG